MATARKGTNMQTNPTRATRTLSAEEELNELRSMVAREAAERARRDAEQAELIKSLEAKLAEAADVSDPGERTRSQIVQLLATANDGRPGSLSKAQIGEACNLTKSAVHNAVNELEKKGKVWVRATHDPSNGRPCHVVYHPAAVRA